MRQAQLQDDEIDLFELVHILWKKKAFIGLTTLIITAIGAAYAFLKTPVYEAKALFEIGTYISDSGGSVAVDDATALEKRLNLLFIELEGVSGNNSGSITKISAADGLKTFLEIKSEAASNEQAKAKILDILSFVQGEHKKNLDVVLSKRRTEHSSLNSQLANIGYKTDQQANLWYRLQERKSQIEALLLPQNYKNTELVGEVLLHKTPVKPKKTFIILTAFAVGLMTSIVLALFLNFFEGARQFTKPK